ncbi:hypothetical protein HBI88_015170 [Parastagonospora nodorum]|nr:hypothetical protein HBH72_104880 [Parastagonospora nodorum]KAH5205820.1 hypothetical protein HBH68_093980 [Parastagonospora nodorum]KAH5371958.1 hypothetical protein HBI48_040080 [Parastagonospora nodorum]KAH5749558.1 hypothetical protein HBI17_106620 [Parastagonospora nodorum]KAH5776120.1 hypothetical protein HBI97_131780 [Parastagonospora nodorum]
MRFAAIVSVFLLGVATATPTPNVGSGIGARDPVAQKKKTAGQSMDQMRLAGSAATLVGNPAKSAAPTNLKDLYATLAKLPAPDYESATQLHLQLLL